MDKEMSMHEAEKIEKKNNFFLYLSIAFVICVFIWGVFIHNWGDAYVFKGNFEGELNHVYRCEETWHYENVDAIPCIDGGGQIGGIMLEFVNFSLDPFANCLQYGWSFPGFNILNETRNQEIIKSVAPICEDLDANNLTEEWFNENTYCTVIACPIFYSPAPHFVSWSYSCIKRYNIPFFKETTKGECVEWFKEDGELYIIKK